MNPLTPEVIITQDFTNKNTVIKFIMIFEIYLILKNNNKCVE